MGRERVAEDVRAPGEADRPSRAYFRLLRGLERADGFTLFLAQCDSHDVRRETIARAQVALNDRGTPVVSVDLSENDNPLVALSAYCATPPPVIMAYGLEEPTDDETRLIRVLRRLNIERERFRDELACPLVLWLGGWAIGLMAQHAPDFYDWRSTLLVFEADSFDSLVASEARQELDIITAPGRAASVADIDATLPPLLDLLSALRHGPRTAQNRASLVHIGRKVADWLIYANRSAEAIGLIRELLTLMGERNTESRARLLTRLADAYTFQPAGNVRRNVSLAIQSCREALATYKREECPRDWAEVQVALANAYKQLQTGNRSKSIQRSIGYYEAALTVYNQRHDPLDWARAHCNLGGAYWALPTGDKRRNLARALRCCEAALRVFTESDYPADWAMMQNNLGVVYQAIQTGSRAQNLKRAISCHEAALRVYTEDQFPTSWALAQNNLGIAYRRLPTGDKAHNVHRAIECYEAALRVYTEGDFPADWAMTQNNLGAAYQDLPDGDRAHNLQRAVQCYEAALRVRTEDDRAVEWAKTTANVGLLLLDHDGPGDIGANRQRAIECFRSTLRVYTPECFPMEYADVRDILAELGVEAEQ